VYTQTVLVLLDSRPWTNQFLFPASSFLFIFCFRHMWQTKLTAYQFLACYAMHYCIRYRVLCTAVYVLVALNITLNLTICPLLIFRTFHASCSRNCHKDINYCRKVTYLSRQL